MEQEVTLDLHEIIEVLSKRKKMIFLVTVIFVLISFVFGFFIAKPTYESKSTIVIGKAADSNKDQQNNLNDVVMYQKLVKTYAQIAKSRKVMGSVVDKVGNGLTIEDLEKRITVTPQTDTQILDLKVTAADPGKAHEILNSLCENFIKESKAIYPLGQVELLDKATMPERPIKPNKKLYILIAFFLGIFTSIGISFLLEYLDRTIKTEQEIERILDLPVIATIPKIHRE